MADLLPNRSALDLRHLRVEGSKWRQSARYKRLLRLHLAYKAQSYDDRRYNFDLTVRGQQYNTTEPERNTSRVRSQDGTVPPYKERRPDVQRCVVSEVVDTLTTWMYGEEGLPEVSCMDDADTADFLEAVIDEARCYNEWVRARNFAGAMGTAVVIVEAVNGVIRVKAVDPKNITVLRWADRDRNEPAEVLRRWLTRSEDLDEDGNPSEAYFWNQQYWSETEFVEWEPVEDKSGKPAVFEREKTRIIHNIGLCPVIWMQNQPAEDDDEVDGEPDVPEQVHDLVQAIDTLQSAINRGYLSNLEATLVLKTDPAQAKKAMTGSNTTLAVGETGDARYLELTGNALSTAQELVDVLRRQVHQRCGVVELDPERIAGMAQSGTALRLLLKPMLVKIKTLREQLSRGFERMAKIILAIEDSIQVLEAEDGSVVEVKQTLLESLPTRTDEDGKPRPYARGNGSRIYVDWGKTLGIDSAEVERIVHSTATAKAARLISQETAVYKIAALFNIDDVDAEVAAIEEEKQAASALFMPGEVASDGDQGAAPARRSL